MTREEALKILQREKDCVQQAIQTAVDGQGYVSPDGMIRAEDYVEACAAALTALRPVSREEVEKVWRAHWNESTHLGGFVYCSRCGYNALEANNYTFCPKCGSPFTDEAVEMVMERMEALYERNDD